MRGQTPSHRRRARTRGQAPPGGPLRDIITTAGQRYLHGRVARPTWTALGRWAPEPPLANSGKRHTIVLCNRGPPLVPIKGAPRHAHNRRICILQHGQSMVALMPESSSCYASAGYVLL
jgi:hypothetical protein